MASPLTPEQIERYSRHIILRGVGGRGQAKLLSASVHIEGGAAASWALAYLVAAGVGRITVAAEPGYPLGDLADARAINPDCQLLVSQSPAPPSDWVVALGLSEPRRATILDWAARNGAGRLFGAASSPSWLAVVGPQQRGCPSCAQLPDRAEVYDTDDPLAAALSGSLAATLLLREIVGPSAAPLLWLDRPGGTPEQAPLSFCGDCPACRC